MIKLNKLFRDGMILQQGVPVKIWGEADYPVTVSVDMHSAVDYARNGKFSLTLPAHDAGGPYTMFVECAGEVSKIHDVYFGEVFLAGGQSNMAMTLEDLYQPLDSAEYPVRIFTTDREWEYSRRPETDERWIEISEENKHGISATASHFAIALSNKLKVPVGIISCNQGASVIRAWMSPDVTSDNPIFNEGTKWHPDADSDDFPFNRTNYLYLERLQHLHPYTIKGVIWYQGESDSELNMAPRYRDLFEMMVSDWRSKWEREDLPFITVQLANCRVSDIESFALVRECQLMAADTIPNVGMVTIGDIGDVDDIHPKDKKTLGERLALYARGMIYGEEVTYRPPVCREASFDGEKVTLKFSDAGEGLYETKKHKFLAVYDDGAEREVPYEICGDSVKLNCDGKAPAEICFCFDNESPVFLYSSVGLPVSPFRIKL